jgi:archaellum component FlaC
MDKQSYKRQAEYLRECNERQAAMIDGLRTDRVSLKAENDQQREVIKMLERDYTRDIQNLHRENTALKALVKQQESAVYDQTYSDASRDEEMDELRAHCAKLAEDFVFMRDRANEHADYASKMTKKRDDLKYKLAQIVSLIQDGSLDGTDG